MKHYFNHINATIKKYWDLPAISNFGAETLTYGDLATGIEKYHILFKECGIKKDDKIAICGGNSAQWGVAYLAVAAYDAVLVPLLPDFLPKSVVELTCFADCRMLIVDNDILRGLERDDALKGYEGQPDFLGVFNLKTMAPVLSFSDEFTKAAATFEDIFKAKYPNGVTANDVDYSKSDDDMERLALISFTSGTSSSPKGVMLSVRSLSSNIRFAHKAIPVQVGGRVLSILPLAHMFGMTFDFLYPLSIGGQTTVLAKKPTPARLLAALAEVKPFMFLTVPLLIEKIFRAKVMPTLQKPVMKVLTAIPGINKIIYNKVRTKLLATFGGNLERGSLIVGGAAINEKVEQLMKKMNFPYTVGYGMTECAPLICYRNWKTFVMRSCGQKVERMEVRIDSEDPRNVVGEIQMKGDNVMMGYYKNPEATKATFTEDGWLKSGDLGVIDADGNVTILTRTVYVESVNAMNATAIIIIIVVFS